ncbi:phage tail tape measure protein [Kushneria phosphatilytica]|uniref:Phage tail tape measure protein n=1 Tax=Kushneria phosphatilytica TaxID=657387 RepID=A0A1S1NXQ7_9GAMM|nr:phage tail tape measure protein [Kushneria phosphatilytica]OHV11193.1 phage tail tape measure protein [Kushneria phosphatilytica]QEL12236.1 phage tail tape measure protein [Kushneria phosphatilytica]
MANPLKLQVVLDAIDKATAPLKKITRGSSKTADALKASKQALRDLERQQRDLGSFRKLKEATRENGEALAAAQERLRNMRAELKQTDAPTEKFQRQFKQASDEVDRLTGKMGDQRRRLGELRSSLKQGGVSTDNLGQSENRLAEQIREANQQFDAQKRKMGEVARAQKKAQQAADQYHRGVGRANAMRGSGFTGLATGGAALYGAGRLLAPGVEYGEQMSAVQAVGRFNAKDEQFKALKQQSRDLGSSTQFSASQVGAGQEFLLRAGMSAKAIQSSMKDVLNLAIANNTELGRTADIASNIAGTFKIDLEKEGAMGHVADVLSATASRANVDLEKLGETVKYLGGAEDLDLTLEQASAMAGLLGNIGIQGSQAGTTLRGMMNRLTDPSKEAAEVIKNLGVQVSNADGEMRSMPEILRDINNATKDLGNADRKQALQQIFGAEAGSGMAELVSQMSTGALDELIEKLRVASGENDRMAKTMADNIGGDLKNLRSAWEEVGISITDTNEGPLRDLIQQVTGITRGIGNWIKANPELAGGIAKAAAGLATLVAVGGAFTIMLASILGPIVTVRYGMAMLGLRTEGLGGKIYSLTSRILPALGRGILLIGRSLAMAGRLLLTNPIGIAITLLATAAYMIYQNWAPISQFFRDRWEDIKTAFNGGVGSVMKLLMNWNPIALIYRGITAGLAKLGIEIPEKFTSLGGFIVDGLIGGVTSKIGALKDRITGMASSVKSWFADVLGINSPSRVFMEFGGWTIEGLISGLTSKLAALKDRVTGIAGSVAGWFKEKLGIHSPSRVFTQLGGYTVDGLNVGLDAQRHEPARRVAEIARNVQRAGAGMALGALALPAVAAPGIDQGEPIRFDSRPPLSQQAAPSYTDNSTSHYTITITAPPGSDEHAIAKAVSRELDRREQERAARQRSSMWDRE